MIKRVLKLIRNWVYLFGIFIPYGYLDWWFAIPLSFVFSCAFLAEVLTAYKESKV
jgi:hypothetical protein